MNKQLYITIRGAFITYLLEKMRSEKWETLTDMLDSLTKETEELIKSLDE